MPRIVFFDEAGVPQRVTRVTGISEDEGQYIRDGRTDFVVSPDLSLLEGLVERRYWKHDAGSIVEYTQSEKDAQDAADAASEDADTRASAKGELLGFASRALLLRALADIIKDEINILRALHSLPARTLTQLRDAISARIDDGTVDS